MIFHLLQRYLHHEERKYHYRRRLLNVGFDVSNPRVAQICEYYNRLQEKTDNDNGNDSDDFSD